MPDITHCIIDFKGSWHLSIWVISSLLAIYLIKPLTFTKALWTYVILWCLFIIEAPFVFFGPYNTAFQATAGQALAEALIIPYAIFSMKKPKIEFLLKYFRWIILYEIICIWLRREGLMIASSFDAALVALYVPFAPPWLCIISLITIIFHHNTTALAMIFSIGLVYGLKYRKTRIPIFGLLLITLIGSILFGKDQWSHTGLLLSAPERMLKYKEYMAFWWSSGWISRVFGLGAGSFIWFSLMIDKFLGTLFLSMHSDWLQILFEYGIIGFILSVGTLVRILKKAWNKPQLLSGVCAGVVFMAWYHPAHWAPSLVLMCLIVGMVYLE